MKYILILIFAIFSFSAQAKRSQYSSIKGYVSYVFDGDTIMIDDIYKIRLQGIDCPESKQLCKNKLGDFYKCGAVSTAKLKELIDHKMVICEIDGKDRYKRYLGTCYINEVNINSYMVNTGNAFATSYDKEYYQQEEKYAKENKLGLWDSSFTKPARWRMKYGRSEVYKF